MDARTWSLLLNSLILAAGTCAVAVPAGAVLAWVLARTDAPLRRAGIVLVGAMLLVPLYLQAAAWQAGFGQQGWWTLRFGGPVWLDGWRGAIWVHAMAAIPWVVLIVGAGLRLIEPELEEQAALDGSPWQVFTRVTLPGALPAVGVATLWTTIVAAGEMTVTDLFVVRTYAEEIYTQASLGAGPGELALGMLPGVLLVAALIVAGLVLCARLAANPRPPSVRRGWVFRLGRWRWPATAMVGLALLLLVGVPLGSLVYKAGVLVTQTETGRLRAFSLGKCVEIVAESPWRYRRELGWSMALGLIAATTATAAGVVLAWPARRGGLRAAPAGIVSAAALAVPGPLVGLGVIWLLNRPGWPMLIDLYDHSLLAPALALFVRALAPATLILWHAFRTLPRELLDAAALDGAGRLGRLARVAIPCRRAALGLAWLVALAVALGDLAASVLVVPPGVTTLSIRIFGLLHYGVEDQVAGICLAQIALFVAIVGMVAYTGRYGVFGRGAPRRTRQNDGS
ncbi:MAG: iron ABC transporter permease [Pirellulales bacterium]|nr:iron ABC transporter permease [Pirellulales bacterium]